MNKSKQYKRNERRAIFVLLMIVAGGIQTASASYVEIKNTSEYGNGVTDNFGYIGANLATDSERIQFINITNTSIDAIRMNISQNHGGTIADWTMVLYDPTDDDVTDVTVSSSKVLFAVKTSTVNAGVITFPLTTALNLSAGTYGLWAGWDSNGDYTDHELACGGITANCFVYLQQWGAASSNSMGWRYTTSWQTIPTANVGILNVTLMNDSDVLHINGLQNYDPTYSTVHSWYFTPQISTNGSTANTSFSLNGATPVWRNNTNLPMFLVNETDAGFTLYGNNSITVYSANFSNSSMNATRTVYINQTAFYYTTASSPGQYEIAPDGTFYRFYINGVYNSTDNGVTWKTVTLTGRNYQAVGLNTLLFYNSSTIFASNGTFGNVSVSYNYGKTFTQVLTTNDWVWNFVNYNGYVFAPTYNTTLTKNAHIYRTSDAGQTWSGDILDAPDAKHVHGIGMIGDKLFATIGDNDPTKFDITQMGIKVSSNPTAATPTWTKEVSSYYQSTTVVNASGTAVFGGDSFQDSILSRDSQGRYSTSAYNISNRNAEYYGLYDSSEDVTYLVQALDLGVYPVWLFASPDKGKTWYSLFNISHTSGTLSNISSDGFIYLKTSGDSAYKVKTINKTALTATQKLITTIYAENALLNRTTDSNYTIDVVYSSPVNITYYDTLKLEDLWTQGHPTTLMARNGSFNLTTDAIFGLNLLNTVYPNRTVTMSISNNTQNSSLKFIVTPSADMVNITVASWDTTGNYHRVLTVSSNTPANPTTFIIGDFPANTQIRANVNGVTSDFISNSTGYIQFIYSGDFSSPLVFSVSLLPFPTSTQSNSTSGLLEAAVIFLAVVFILSIFPFPEEIKDDLNILFAVVGILFIIAIFITS